MRPGCPKQAQQRRLRAAMAREPVKPAWQQAAQEAIIVKALPRAAPTPPCAGKPSEESPS